MRAKRSGRHPLNHVDGRDKPGHDGKRHGNQRLSFLFLVATAAVIASDSEATQTEPQLETPSLGCFALLAMTGIMLETAAASDRTAQSDRVPGLPGGPPLGATRNYSKTERRPMALKLLTCSVSARSTGRRSIEEAPHRNRGKSWRCSGNPRRRAPRSARHGRESEYRAAPATPRPPKRRSAPGSRRASARSARRSRPRSSVRDGRRRCRLGARHRLGFGLVEHVRRRQQVLRPRSAIISTSSP